MAQFDVYRLSDAEEARSLLGQVEVGDGGQLKLLRAEPGAQAALDRALADLNGRQGLALKLPPGPKHPKYAIVKKLIARDDPRFFEAIEDNLKRWHNMALSPAI